MIDVRFLILLFALGSSPGCVTSAGEKQETGPDTTVVASNAASQTDGAESGSEQPEVVMQETVIAGKSEVGEKVYCRRRAPVGSRLPVTKCVTESQRRENEEFAKKIFKNRDLRK